MLVDILLTGETASAGSDTLLTAPPAALAASIDFHSASAPAGLGTPQYPSCAYDVHAIANRSTTPRMYQFGGFSPDYSITYNRVSFTQNNFATVAMYNPSYSGNTSVITGRAAGGAALLANGNLLWMGGGVPTAAGKAHDVVYSTNNGQSFAVATTAALWSARSDFSTVVLPLTNIVLVIGGQAATGGPINDVYVSTDGLGATWTKQTIVPSGGGFLDAATTALFDGKAVTGGSQAYSTVLVAPSDAYTTNSIFASVDLGVTWTVVGPQPWGFRARNQMTADVDNYVYATGGIADGEVYFSYNGGKAWTVLTQLSSSTIWANTVIYTSSHDNCQFITNTANANSPNGYHKTLIVYGGGTTTANQGVITVATPSPNCTTSSAATVVFGELLLPCELACGYNGTCPAGASCATALAPGSSSSGSASGASAASSSAASAVSAAITAASTAASAASSTGTVASTTSSSTQSNVAVPSSSSSSSPNAASSASSASALPTVTATSSSSTGSGSPGTVNAAQRATSSAVASVAAALSIALALVVAA